jgi:hypothetical protein
MAIDPVVPRSRRALLGAALGAGAATLASALGRPLSTRAADGDPMVVGGEYTATSVTKLTNTTNADRVLEAISTSGWSIHGQSSSGTGVWGQSTSLAGVYATSTSYTGMEASSSSSYGIHGYNDSATVPAVVGQARGNATGVWGYSNGGVLPGGQPTKTGVYGYAAQDTASNGVYGKSPAGTGVKGDTTSGTGVFGTSSSGTGVLGSSVSGTAVTASGGSGVGLSALVDSGTAVNATSQSGDSLHASTASTSDNSSAARASSTGSTGFTFGAWGSALSPDGTGVMGEGAGWGVWGESSSTSKPATTGYSTGNHTGVVGWSGPTSPWASGKAKTGVYGYAAQDSGSRGVWGVSPAGQAVRGEATSGRGVYGQATTGYGVRGQATTGSAVYAATTDPLKGYALRAIGRVKLDKCAGVATIAAGTRSIVVIPGIDLVSTSAVVATLQGNPGGTTTVQRVAVNTTTNAFTIYLTANSTASVKVAWHVFG